MSVAADHDRRADYDIDVLIAAKEELDRQQLEQEQWEQKTQIPAAHWTQGAEPGMVANATQFPGCCETCGSQKGPMLDWQVDRPAMGAGASVRVYQCVKCIRKSCELAGFAPGEKLDQLENAAAERDLLEKRVAEAEDATRKMANALTNEQQQSRTTQTLLDQERERREQDIFRLQQIQSLANELTVTRS